jgi:hypothetical protein
MRHPYFSLLFLGLVLACFLAPATPVLGAPKLVLKEQAYDFKQVAEGRLLEHVFPIFNKGNQVLKIQKVETS